MMKIETNHKPYYEYIAEQYSDIKVVVNGTNIRASAYKFIEKSLKSSKIVLETTIDLVDQIWKQKPGFPNNKLLVLDQKYSGKAYKEKKEEVWKEI